MLENSKLMGFIPTTDFTKARHFYGSVLGLRFVSEDPFAVVYEASGTRIRIARVEELVPFPFTILGWEVQRIEDLVTKLAGEGVTFERFPWMQQSEVGIWTAPSGDKVAWFRDPDGNILSLSERY